MAFPENVSTHSPPTPPVEDNGIPWGVNFKIPGEREKARKFQGVVRILMEFQGKERKKWKILGGSESSDGIPGKVRKNGKFQGVVKVLMEFQGK